MSTWTTVTTAADLAAAAVEAGTPATEVQGTVRGMPMLTLDPVHG